MKPFRIIFDGHMWVLGRRLCGGEYRRIYVSTNLASLVDYATRRGRLRRAST